ncbi:M42 family peptidase [Terribacillus saccharophilus]|uniref:M42 family metallopeptidase n=1 Tax=Terribacillus saccharophilus TaxID=361277 RepID=UPI0039826986
MKERIKDHLRNLTNLVGVSGSEQEVVRYMNEHLLAAADEVNVDHNGNVIAVKHGTSPGPKLMIGAHSDEVGFSVKSIQEDGYLYFDKIGVVSDQLLQGRKVWISSRKIPGVMGIKAGHLQTAEESRQVKPLRDCYIDIGASSKEEAEAIGIKIGDPIVFQSDFMELSNTDLISTKSVDNRISCAILIELFHQLKGKDFAGTVYGVVTVQEEVGLRGVASAAFTIDPDYAIILDTIPSGDTPDIDTEKVLPVFIGKGPACPVGDGVFGWGSYIHPKVREMIEEQSEKVQIPIQYVSLIGENYSTDAAALTTIGKGVPVGVLAIPRRYSHSPVELVNLRDAVDVLKVVKGIIGDNGKKSLSFI